MIDRFYDWKLTFNIDSVSLSSVTPTDTTSGVIRCLKYIIEIGDAGFKVIKAIINVCRRWDFIYTMEMIIDC